MTNFCFTPEQMAIVSWKKIQTETGDKFRRTNLPHDNSFVILHVTYTTLPCITDTKKHVTVNRHHFNHSTINMKLMYSRYRPDTITVIIQ